mgnify:CR=1 FL=1
MRLYLVGYMGCGKSSIGRKIARRLGVEFIDTDAVVEQAEQATIADIIGYAGEEYFRRCERKALDDTALHANAIVSTGGGLPVWHDNMERIHALGTSVYIRRTPEQILSRLSPYGRQKRPKFRGLDDEQLLAFMHENMAEREPVYAQADFVIDGEGRSDNEIIEAVLEFLNGKEN